MYISNLFVDNNFYYAINIRNICVRHLKQRSGNVIHMFNHVVGTVAIRIYRPSFMCMMYGDLLNKCLRVAKNTSHNDV